MKEAMAIAKSATGSAGSAGDSDAGGADSLAAVYVLTEAQYAENEANDPFVGTYITHAHELFLPLQRVLSASNFRAILGIVAPRVGADFEDMLQSKRCNQVCGDLCLLYMHTCAQLATRPCSRTRMDSPRP